MSLIYINIGKLITLFLRRGGIVTNFDMISRNAVNDTLGNKAQMLYTEDYKGIRTITEKNLKENKINLDLSYMASKVPGGGSDHASFSSAGIPVFYFEAAMHTDYHQPSDEINKINWDKMIEIIKIGFLNSWEFANSDEFLKSTSETN